MSMKKNIPSSSAFKCTARRELSLAESRSLQEAAEMLDLNVSKDNCESVFTETEMKVDPSSVMMVVESVKCESDNPVQQFSDENHKNHNGEVVICEGQSDDFGFSDNCNEPTPINDNGENASESGEKLITNRQLKVELIKLNFDSDSRSKPKFDAVADKPSDCVGFIEPNNSVELNQTNVMLHVPSNVTNYQTCPPDLKSTIGVSDFAETPKRRPGRPRKQPVDPNSPICEVKTVQVKTVESDDDSLEAQFSKRSSRRIKKPKKFADYELNMSKLKYDKVRGDVATVLTSEIVNSIKPELPPVHISEKKVIHVKPTVINHTSQANNSKDYSKSSHIPPNDREVETLSAIMAEIQKIAPDAAKSSKADAPSIENVEHNVEENFQESEVKEDSVVTVIPCEEVKGKEPHVTMTDEGLIVLEPLDKETSSEVIIAPKISECKTLRVKKNKKKKKESEDSLTIDTSVQDVSMFIISRDRPEEEEEEEEEEETEEVKQTVDDMFKKTKKQQKARRLASYLEDKGIVHDGMVECKICGKLLKICSFKQHLRTHEGVKPFECGICGSCFTRKGDAERHIRVVHKQENLYNCCECGRNFQDKKNLRWHLMNHDKRMVYQCEYCGFKFGKKEYYDNHVKFIHIIGILEHGLNVPEEEEEEDEGPPKAKKVKKRPEPKVLQLESESLVDAWESDNMESITSDIVQVKDNNITSYRVISPNEDLNKGEKNKLEEAKAVISPNIVFSGQAIQISGIGSENIDAAALVQELENVISQDPGSVIVVDGSVVDAADLSKVLTLDPDQVNKLYKTKCVTASATGNALDKNKSVEDKKRDKCENKAGQGIVLSGVDWEVKGEQDKVPASLVSSLVLGGSQSDGVKVKNLDHEGDSFSLGSAGQTILTVDQTKTPQFNILKDVNGTRYIAEVSSTEQMHESLSEQQVTELEHAPAPDNSDPSSLLLQTEDGMQFQQIVMTKEGQTMLLTTDGRAIRVENIMPGDGETLQVVMETNEDGQPQILQVAELDECCETDNTSTGDLIITPGN